MNVRQAIGAIIFCDDKFLLSCRGMMLTTAGFKKISPEWDLVKGGIDEGESPKEALLRELYEETGSRNYVISKQFKDRLLHGLPESTGFDRQEVTMFLVRYIGDGKDLKPDSNEIVELKFFDKKEAIAHIKYPETKKFFQNNV